MTVTYDGIKTSITVYTAAEAETFEEAVVGEDDRVFVVVADRLVHSWPWHAILKIEVDKDP